MTGEEPHSCWNAREHGGNSRSGGNLSPVTTMGAILTMHRHTLVLISLFRSLESPCSRHARSWDFVHKRCSGVMWVRAIWSQ